MGYPRHVLVQFGGSIGPAGAAYEEWSCGVRVHYDNTAAPDRDLTVDEQEDYLADTVFNALTRFWTNDLPISSNANVQWVKVNAIDANGHYVHNTTTQFNWPGDGLRTTNTSPTFPTQVSVVTTFETEMRRGYASRGRIYLPTPAITFLAGTGQFSATECEQLATKTAQFVGDLDATLNDFGIDLTPAVVSKMGNSGAGTWNEITSVSVDTVPDTQRRRTNQIQGARRRAPVNQ